MNTAIDPSPPRRRTRLAIWTAIGLGALVIGALGALLAAQGRWDERTVLDPESAGPNGSRALVEILRDHGVDVRVVRDHESAEGALGSGTDTLVMLDTPALSDDGVEQLTDAATDVVLLDPRARTLDLLIPGSAPAGYAADLPLEPDCAFDVAARAGSIIPGATFTAGSGEGCYTTDAGWGLVTAPHGDGRVSAIDGRVLFTNDMLADAGNAALALGLMGQHARLVWYIPGAGDTDLPATKLSLGELTPDWVSPVIVLLLLSGVCAAIWRGRRFGPLVAERLPVTVRASETTEGRARLYAQSRDAAHAAEQLRHASAARLARSMYLGAAADRRAIADAAASLTGSDRARVHALLIDDVPNNDAQLVTVFERLSRLEAAVNAAAHPERMNP
ncbi:DUF4350 domain-containing protein [Microbacterium sp. C7(2022)]|uniref:DUF4350 domain-containing protein n=1 Tax=Microbacterium sp. C7(2022) TaxID=2992759 RepID=UPI00237A2AD7|nr:DUF4350 domain-containing protein [Microbacterium sp. C7(2022)]MDE0547303.1 DUF4350 domain-containing protein [Microbacterium sp. C7(2022)]